MQLLEQTWWAEAGRNQVLPLYDFPASLAHMHPSEFPAPERAVYRMGGSRIIESQLPTTIGGFELAAQLDIPPAGAEGIICALGDRNGGWALYLLQGRLTATVALLGSTVRVSADTVVPSGGHTVGFRYEPGREPRVVLTVDGAISAEQPLPGLFFFPNLSTAGAGMHIGRDAGFAVSDDYRPPFAFTGQLHQVEMTTTAPGAQPDQHTITQVAFAAD